MDFIVGLPKSDGYTKIWVIVDRFSKMAHFIPLRTEEHIKELALTFVKEIWRLHGLPESIVSDRDTRFTSKFWTSLMQLLQVKLNMSTAFYPESAGQTERVNQTLEQYLRSYCTYQQDDGYPCYRLRNMVIIPQRLNPRRLVPLKLIRDSPRKRNGRGWCQIIREYTQTVSLWLRIGKAHGKKSERQYKGHRRDNGNGMIRKDSQLQNMSHWRMSSMAGLRKQTE